MLSAKANELDEAIRAQDVLLARAVMEDVPVQFQQRMLAVRNSLVRDLAIEWRTA